MQLSNWFSSIYTAKMRLPTCKAAFLVKGQMASGREEEVPPRLITCQAAIRTDLPAALLVSKRKWQVISLNLGIPNKVVVFFCSMWHHSYYGW